MSMPVARTWWQDRQQAPPLRRYRVEGRAITGHRYEIGYFFGRTPNEACGEARKRKGHLCGGLRLEAEARL